MQKNVIDQMLAHDMPPLPPGHPILDGKVHRFGRQKKAWYTLREITLKSGKSVVVGGFGIWRGTDNGAVPVKIDWTGISEEERLQAKAKQEAYDRAAAEHKAKLATFAKNRATMQWKSVDDISNAVSPYLARKNVDAENVKVDPNGTLLIPACNYDDAGVPHIVGLQKVEANGDKRFNRGMAKQGAYLLLGQPSADEPVIMIGEGYATCESVRMATDKKYPVAVSFDCGNLMHVARNLRHRFPKSHLLFLADDDWQLVRRFRERVCEDFGVLASEPDGTTHKLKTKEGSHVVVKAGVAKDNHGDEYIVAQVTTDKVKQITFYNAGITHAKAAASDVGNASVIFPKFKSRTEQKWTDFNDLHNEESLKSVRSQVNAALVSIEKGEAVLRKFSLGIKAAKKVKETSAKSLSNIDRMLKDFYLVYGTTDVYDSGEHMLLEMSAVNAAFGSAARIWREHPLRKTVMRDNIIFDPGYKQDQTGCINLFHGWPLKPQAGKFEKILELLNFLCNDDINVLSWVIKWIAYPLQHPGAKMRSAIIMHGDEGSGKNLFWESVVKKIYGEYAGVIGSEQIENQFNEWASKKMFILADEVITRSELRATKGRIKKMITGETVFINPKNLTAREETNHMNFVFLSNELQPIQLDSSDRRYLVLWTPKKQNKSFYSEVVEEIKNGGIEAFYEFLLTFDLEDFNEYTDVPMTEAKRELISLGLSSSERFFYEWESKQIPVPYISCSASQLYSAFIRWCNLSGERWPPTQTRFGREIMRIAGDKLTKKAVKYNLESDIKQRICYLIGYSPDSGQDIQTFVERASGYFENCLQKYRSGVGYADSDAI